MVLTRRAIALAASLALAAPALAAEPGGFRPGLYLGETAAACAAAFFYCSGGEDGAIAIFLGVVPNAFANAYVYNRVKEPAAGDVSARFSVAPYVAACRGGRGEPMPVYGLALSF